MQDWTTCICETNNASLCCSKVLTLFVNVSLLISQYVSCAYVPMFTRFRNNPIRARQSSRARIHTIHIHAIRARGLARGSRLRTCVQATFLFPFQSSATFLLSSVAANRTRQPSYTLKVTNRFFIPRSVYGIIHAVNPACMSQKIDWEINCETRELESCDEKFPLLTPTSPFGIWKEQRLRELRRSSGSKA